MNYPKSCIAVLWDDDLQSENALLHAIRLAEKSSFSIVLLRVIKKRRFLESIRSFESFVESETLVLKQKVELLSEKHSTPIGMHMLKGNIKRCIKDFLESSRCALIVSPEHVVLNKGIKVNVLKEFSKYGAIEIPIMIATTAPRTEFSTIEVVVPMEYQSEFKDTIEWVIHFSRKYGCNFDFVRPVVSATLPQKDLMNNIYFTKQVLDANEVVYGIKTANKENNFIDDVYDFADDINANYILSTTLSYSAYRKNERFQQYPFICVNPQKRRYATFN